MTTIKTIRTDIVQAFLQEERELCQKKAKTGILWGFLFNLLFIAIDYSYAPAYFHDFFVLRILLSLELMGSYLFIQIFHKQSLYWASAICFGVVISFGIALTSMCYLSGGFNSLYVFGYIFALRFIQAMFPWHPAYQIGVNLIFQLLYLSQLAFVGLNAPLALFLTYNLFIMTSGLLSSLSCYTQYKTRFQLKVKDQFRNDFFSNVSHELRTLVTLALVPLESALEGSDLSTSQITVKRSHLVSAQHNIYRLSHLISDLLDLTRGEIGRVYLRPTPIADGEQYFSELFQSTRTLMEEKGLTGEFTMEVSQ